MKTKKSARRGATGRGTRAKASNPRIFTSKRHRNGILGAFLALAVVAVALLGGPTLTQSMASAAAKAKVAKTEVLTYGDSVTYESAPDVVKAFKKTKTDKVAVHSLYLTAPCDWLGWLAQDEAIYHPQMVVVASAGDSAITCMDGVGGQPLAIGSTAYFAKYQADLSTFVTRVTATGARLVFVEGPPMLDPTWNAAIIQIGQYEAQLAAANKGVTFSTGPRNAVSKNGQYVSDLPCLAGEKKSQGCKNGQIAVRSVSGPGQNGVHFCPTGITGPASKPCPEYSSGEVRWADAIAAATVAAQ